MKLLFHGALGTVTGSLHILETTRGELLLLDCGMFQGRRAEARERNLRLPIAPDRVRAVLLSHAHIDHSGNLPTWARNGLGCPIISTEATAELAALLLRDSAHIQHSDALFLNKHRRRGGPLVEPLYESRDAEAAIALFRPCKYREWIQVRPNVRVFFHDAGHILGSGTVTVEEQVNGSRKRLSFTGDLGRPGSPILRDPEPFSSGADAAISESTYGNKDHPPQTELADALRKVIYQTIARGGRVIIPAFAVGRAQMLLYVLRQLQTAGKLPEIPVFLDSPLAAGATEIFRKHRECYDEGADAVTRKDGVLFALEGFIFTPTKEDSQALNERREPCIVIAASGMCEAGRILHHLEHGLGNPRNTILIVGFQAEHTLGYKLVTGWKTVRVLGQEQEVRAEVVVFHGFSAHAGQSELAGYLERCRPAGPVFLVHGDEKRTTVLKDCLASRGFPEVRIPREGDTYQL